MLSVLKSFIYACYYYILGTIGIFEDYIFRGSNKCKLVDCCGRVAVITGGARGIGTEVVKKLLQCNMHVIIGCRCVDRGLALVHRLRTVEGVTSGSSSVLSLDLSSLDSVRAFATAVTNARLEVHLLINNGGIMFPPYMETVDGFESQWGVNYASHFLLTHLLMPALRRAATGDGGATARVVSVTSCAHKASRPINFNNVNMKPDFLTQAAYAQSKLAQLLFTLHLARSSASDSVSFVAVHPGIVNTDLFDGTLMKTLLPWAPGLLFKTVEEAATTVMYAALHAKNGEYISNGLLAAKSVMARDQSLQRELFEHTLQTLGIKSFGSVS